VSRMISLPALIATFVGGVALMIPFEATVTRILGMTLLFAFVIIGVLLIAEPGFLARDEEE
jgi:flagellar biosynthesis protein FliQ